MIYSDKQKATSLRELSKMRAALAAATDSNARDDTPQWLQTAQAEALGSQIATLEAEIAHYERLRNGEVRFAKTHSLEDLPSVLVHARIAAGLSQTELAQRLGMKAQQIQRYEASEYASASLQRLIEVADVLDVHSANLFDLQTGSKGSIFTWSEVDDVVWQEFPAREMARRGWFDTPRGEDVYDLARSYFMEAAGAQFATAYHRKKMHGGSIPNEYALLAWQARILELAGRVVEKEDPPAFVADDRWLSDLVALTRDPNGPALARNLLLSKGIVLVVEKHLRGTHLDGGAMLDRNGRPVIGLTLRYDRLDNFWFVLMHELGHVFLHLTDGLGYDFFDEEEPAEDDVIEREADEFALSTLIPDEMWNSCLSRFALTEVAVRMDAERLQIDPSIIAGRIRKDRGDYTLLTSLVGQGRVRVQFEDAEHELD